MKSNYLAQVPLWKAVNLSAELGWWKIPNPTHSLGHRGDKFPFRLPKPNCFVFCSCKLTHFSLTHLNHSCLPQLTLASIFLHLNLVTSNIPRLQIYKLLPLSAQFHQKVLLTLRLTQAPLAHHVFTSRAEQKNPKTLQNWI